MAKAKSKTDLTPHQLEIAKKEIAREEQAKQDDLRDRQQNCQKELEAVCEKYGMIIQAPIDRNNILDYTARLFNNPNIPAIGATVNIIEKQKKGEGDGL